MNWKKFLEGLAVAAIGGAATTAAQVVVTPDLKPGAISTAAAAGAIIGVAGWLKQSPVEKKPKSKKTPPDPPEQ
jgi:hypothetical protein